MKKIELLAPAGDQESLIAAIQNGADAIYLGGTLFNARAYAHNFDHDQMKWAVEYAHFYDVKIYVTVNTLYQDHEMAQLIEYIDELYRLQVDALIIQDIGLFDIVHSLYPDFEIHMSTQASIMNLQAARYFENSGASRVVLARENTLAQIRDICLNTSLEVEVFVHGAMCVCYSGQCLMSSMIGKRSGNRGQCAQPCRLPYRLAKNQQILKEKYPFLLSPKDMMTVEHVGDLIEAGVTSMKIEGRMKKPEYVASVTRAYRQAIDAYFQNSSLSLEENIYDMKAMFNRDYTTGYLYQDPYIVKGDYSGHKGQLIGRVLRYSSKKKHVFIELCDTLHQGDSIVFEDIDKGRPVNKIYLNGKLVHEAHAHQQIEIEFDCPVYQGKVRKTIDKKVIEKMQSTYHAASKKRMITMFFEAKLNQKARLTLQVDQHQKVTVNSSISVEPAITTPLTQQRIYQQLTKLGATSFACQKVTIDIDDQISIPIKTLNEMRRQACESLYHQLSHKIIHSALPQKLPQLHRRDDFNSPKFYVLVHDLQQLETVCQYPIDYLIYPYQHDIDEAYRLCQKYHKKMIMMTSPVIKEEEIQDILHSNIYQQIQMVLVHDYGAYHAFYQKKRLIGQGLNLYNSYAIAHYQNHRYMISPEMSYQNIKNLTVDLSQAIVHVYGKIENMISEYCPISQYYFGCQKKHCQICKQGQFSLIDRKNEAFDIMTDDHCRMHLLNCHTLYNEQAKHLPIHGLFIHFTNEDSQMTKFVLKHLLKEDLSTAKSIIRQKIKLTSGYFKET